MASVDGDAETQHVTIDQWCGLIFEQSDIVEPCPMSGAAVTDIDVLKKTVVSIVEPPYLDPVTHLLLRADTEHGVVAGHHPRVEPAIIARRASVPKVTLRGASDLKLRVVVGEDEGAGKVMTEAEGSEDDGYCMEDMPISRCIRKGMVSGDEGSQGPLALTSHVRHAGRAGR